MKTQPQPKIDYDLFGPAPRQPRRMFNVGGYAAKPGTGPTGQTCRACAHYTRVQGHGDRFYRKCGLLEAQWTHGPGTDIKAGAPACAFFTPNP